MLDVPSQVKDQRLGVLAFAEREQVLGGDGVQPGQPVLARHGEHLAVRPVHHHDVAVGGALLAQRVTVVPGDPERLGTRPAAAPLPGAPAVATSRARWFQALHAAPGQRKVAGIEHEPELFSQSRSEVDELLRRYLGQLSAPVAHQVHMLVRLGRVARRSVP